MLIPLNRETFDVLVPLSATGAQYRYTWGSFSDCLRRLLVSFAAVIVVVIVGYFLGETAGEPFRLLGGILAGCYWIWGPIYFASRRNWDYRRYKYSGYWRGEVLDRFVTDELVSTGERVDGRGELVVKENREKRLNLEIGDDTGFVTQVKVPYKQDHQGIRRGDVAEMIVVSSRPDMGRIAKISDVFVPDSNVWVSDYPYVQRAAFRDVTQTLKKRAMQQSRPAVDDRYDNDRYDRDDRYAPEPPADPRYPDPRYSDPRESRPRSLQGRPDPYADDGYGSGRYNDEGYNDERYGDEGYGDRAYPDGDRYSDTQPRYPGPRRRRRPRPRR